MNNSTMTQLIYDVLMGNHDAQLTLSEVSGQEVDLNRDTITFRYGGKSVVIKVGVFDN